MKKINDHFTNNLIGFASLDVDRRVILKAVLYGRVLWWTGDKVDKRSISKLQSHPGE